MLSCKLLQHARCPDAAGGEAEHDEIGGFRVEQRVEIFRRGAFVDDEAKFLQRLR
jgi:hypothetical protein